MKKVFKHVDVNLVTPPMDQNGQGQGQSQSQGEGQGQPNQSNAEGNPSGMMQKLLQQMQSQLNETRPTEQEEETGESNDAASNEEKEGRSKLTYKETKEKIQKEIIREMLEKLVINQTKEQKIGRDYFNKRHISRDVCIDAEFKIPNETYSIRKKPMHFYFDFSGSCEEYSGMFAQITSGLIEKGAITYIGENGYISFRIDKAPRGITATDIQELFDDSFDHRKKGFHVTYYDELEIKDVIEREQVERLICYTDYDSCYEMVAVSDLTDTIWFSAERSMRDFNGPKNLSDFKGKFYQARSLDEIKNNLINIENVAFEKRCRMIQTGAIKN